MDVKKRWSNLFTRATKTEEKRIAGGDKTAEMSGSTAPGQRQDTSNSIVRAGSINQADYRCRICMDLG